MLGRPKQKNSPFLKKAVYSISIPEDDLIRLNTQDWQPLSRPVYIPQKIVSGQTSYVSYSYTACAICKATVMYEDLGQHIDWHKEFDITLNLTS